MKLDIFDCYQCALIGMLIVVSSSYSGQLKGEPNFLKPQSKFSGKPLPASQDVKAADQLYVKEYRTYRRNQLIDVYLEHTKDQGEVREKVLAFMEGYLKNLFVQDDWPNAKSIELGERALRAGTKDPLFLAYYAFTLEKENPQKAKAYFKQAAGKLDKQNYSPLNRYMLRYWQTINIRITKRNKVITPLTKAMIDLVKSYRPEEKNPLLQRIIIDRLRLVIDDKRYRPAMEKIRSAFQNEKDLDPWLRQTVIGILSIEIAWFYRGGGYANEVTNEGFAKYGKNLTIAAKNLTAAWQIEPSFPEAPAKMITVTMGQGGGELTVRDWFDRAVAADFSYQQAYESLRWALRPRWLGDSESLFAFGLECANTMRHDTGIPWQLFAVCLDINKDRDEDGSIWSEPGVRDHLMKLLEGRIKWHLENKNLKNVDYYLSMQAGLAIRNKDEEAAKAYLARLNLKADKSALKWLNLDEAALDKFQLETSNVGYLQMVKSLIDEPDLKDVPIELWVQKLDKEISQAEPGVKSQLNSLKNQLVTAWTYAQGDWATIPFDEELSGWKVLYGNWRHDEEKPGALRLTGKGGIGAQIRWRVPFKGPFVIEVNVEMLEKSKKRQFRDHVGFVLGDYYKSKDNYRGSGTLCFLDQKLNSIGYTQPTRNATSWHFTNKKMFQKVNRLRVYAWEGHLKFFLNGTSVKTIEDYQIIPDGDIGLGSLLSWYLHCEARFSDMRIKQLKMGSPSLPDNKIAYWSYRKEVTKGKVANPYWQLALTYHYQGDLEKAETHVKKAGEIDSKYLNYSTVGAIHFMKGEYEKALAIYKQQDYFHTIRSQLKLGLMLKKKYAQAEGELKRAQKLCERGRYRDPFDLAILAEFHARRGEFKQATKWQARANQLYDYMPITPELVNESRERLKHYQQNRSYEGPVNVQLPEMPFIKRNMTTPQKKLPESRFNTRLIFQESFEKGINEPGRGVQMLPSFPVYYQGALGRAIGLSGGNTLFLNSEDTAFAGEDSFTASLWVCGTNSGVLLGRGQPHPDPDCGLHGYVWGLVGGKLYFSFGKKKEERIYVIGKAEDVTEYEWNHLAVSYDGSGKASGVRFFVNGKPVKYQIKKDTFSGQITYEQPLQMGRIADYHWYNGAVDELRIYNRALNQKHIQSVMNDPFE